jgi:hypothetical protein
MPAQVIFRAVRVQRDLGAIEDEEQLLLTAMQAGEQAIEGDEAGRAPEDPLEARPQRRPALGARIGLRQDSRQQV